MSACFIRQRHQTLKQDSHKCQLHRYTEELSHG